jgi:hypothetical protein
MSDIFISYAREDEERIRPLAAALEAHGWSVFWDRRIPAGQTWRSVLGQALHDAKCVIVAWSHHSVASRWVSEEADAGLQRGILVPVLLDQVEPPIGFRSLQAAELASWPVDSGSPAFTQFVQDVRKVLGSPPPPRTVPAEPWVRKRPPSSRTALAGLAVVLLVLAGAAYFYSTRVSEPLKGGADSTISTVSPGAVPASTGGAAAPAAAGAPPSSGSAGSGLEAFAIKIGDKVSDGVPAPGAGFIARPFEHDVYRVTAAPRQTVYFRVWEISATLNQSYLGWRLADQDGTEVFKRGLYAGSPGVHTLVRGGTYTLTVGSNEDAAIGLYQFQLYDVPRPDQFAIELGARIRDGQPGPGAGYIETPGAKDVYTFKAAPRQKVSFRVLGASPAIIRSYLGWRLVDEDGTEIFKQGLYTGHPGVHTLIKGGTYTLTLGSDIDPATGTYDVQIDAQN